MNCEIEYIVDINPRKQDMYIPGTGQLIVPPEFPQEYQPDVVLKQDSLAYISDDDNSLDVLRRRGRRKRWKMCESGPISERLKEGEMPWLLVREDMIRTKYD